MTAQTRSPSSTVVVRTRGVMISPAVRVPNSTERSMSSAVSASRVPWSAERCTSEASSWELRAERSSSCGSMPRRRTIALAEPLSTRIGPRHERVKPRMKPWVARAVASGRAMAMFLGTISPKIIVTTVPRARPSVSASGVTAPSGRPAEAERAVDELGDRRLGEEADRQVGDGDADLGPGELGRQRAQRELDAAGALVAVGGGAVDARPVDGDEGELGGDEEAAGGHEGQ